MCILFLQWPASSSLNDAPKNVFKKNYNVEEFLCHLFNLVTWCGITYIFRSYWVSSVCGEFLLKQSNDIVLWNSMNFHFSTVHYEKLYKCRFDLLCKMNRNRRILFEMVAYDIEPSPQITHQITIFIDIQWS